ncbi:MAG: TonB-dependent receptor [Desulfuromonas sp.]|nr:TonB-dependent receptor [Desulfuromonas sp.]
MKKQGLWLSCLVLCTLLLAPLAAFSADGTTELAPVVVTATLEEKQLQLTPGGVQIIDSEEIFATGAETIGDALLYATGIMLTTGEGRNRGTSLRGLGYQHTLVLIDGRRFAASFKGQMDVGQLPVLLVERVEIVRGPVSALYGSDAIGGVVNIITRKPTQQRVAEIDGRGGFGPSAEHFGRGYLSGGTELVQGNIAASRSVKDDWDGDHELPDDIDQTSLNSVAGAVALAVNEHQQLNIGGEYSHFSRDGGRFILNQERDYTANDRRWGGFAEYHLNQGEPLSAMVRGYVSNYSATSSFEPATSNSTEQRRLIQGEGRLSYMVDDALIVTLGGEVRQDSLEASGMVHDEEDVLNSALFVMADWQLAPQLNMIGGLRYDYHENFGSHVTPRLALNYSFSSGRLWVAYGQGFRAPNLNELYVTATLKKGLETYIGNEDLDAETSDSYEVGASWHAGPLMSQVTLFYNKLDDLIATDLIAASGKLKTYEYANIDHVRTYGSELETQLQLPAHFNWSGQLSWVETENEESNERLADEPCWKGGMSLGWSAPDFGLHTQLRWLYFGTSEDGLGTSQDSYQLLHFYASKTIAHNTQVYAGIDNLLDEEHDDFTLSPRAFYVGLKWKY